MFDVNTVTILFIFSSTLSPIAVRRFPPPSKPTAEKENISRKCAKDAARCSLARTYNSVVLVNSKRKAFSDCYFVLLHSMCHSCDTIKNIYTIGYNVDDDERVSE